MSLTATPAERAAADDGVRFRWRIAARVSRLWRWEFWPRRIFYIPLVPVWCVLAIRHRSLTVWTAANPGMPHGGVVGERKSDILAMLPPESIVPFALVDAREPDRRVEQFRAIVRERGWSFPLIAKPNVGERGTGFRLLRDERGAIAALGEHAEELIVQPYHPGPREAGLFYVRPPGAERGLLFSITDKRFASVIGDGKSTLRTLIWAHERYRMQAERFITRLGARADAVPERGEVVPLATAGNHCQGTLFADGSRLNTPALCDAIDRIASRTEGFHFGRFDIRYRSDEELARGEHFAIIELNGVLSESTNIYDPRRSLLSAYVTLARQWALAAGIGAANARRGARVSSVREVLAAVRAHGARRVPEIAD